MEERISLRLGKARLGKKYLLFGRVIQLVLVGTRETLLNASVLPQSLHAGQQLLGERLRVFHARDDVHHHLGVGLAFSVGESDAQVGHGPQDGHQRLDGVAVDDRPVLLEVLDGEAALVNNSANIFFLV